MAGLKVYIGVDEQLCLINIMPTGQLCPHLFSRFAYVALKDSQALAVEAFLRTATPKQALEEITVFVLEITLTTEHALELFKTSVLKRGRSGLKGFEWHGVVDLTAVTCEWTKLVLEPVGVSNWVRRAMRWKQVCHDQNCTGCGCEGLTWAGNAKHGLAKYCIDCWYEYYLAKC